MVIQLRTQLHMANDLIQEKDQVISTLQEENQKNTVDHSEIDQAKNLARSWEDQYNAMKNKVSHMDTFTNQINEMKQALLNKNGEVDQLNKTIQEKDQQISNLNNQIEELKNPPKEEPAPKKVINTKNKLKPVVIESEKPVEETDDF